MTITSPFRRRPKSEPPVSPLIETPAAEPGPSSLLDKALGTYAPRLTGALQLGAGPVIPSAVLNPSEAPVEPDHLPDSIENFARAMRKLNTDVWSRDSLARGFLFDAVERGDADAQLAGLVRIWWGLEKSLGDETDSAVTS